MDDFEKMILEAWNRKYATLPTIPERLLDRRPLRSDVLALRASDARLDSLDSGLSLEMWDEQLDDGGEEIWRAWIDTRVVRMCCMPVMLEWPGVNIAEASRLLGVNRTTVHAWIRKGILKSKVYNNRANLRRSVRRVWSSWYVDVTGHIWTMEKHRDLSAIVDRFPDNFGQWLAMRHRQLSRRVRVTQWRCGLCRNWFYKLYMPVPTWTLRHHLGLEDASEAKASRLTRFACRKCHKLVYESSERTSRPGGRKKPERRVNMLHRHVKRLTGGLLTGKEIEAMIWRD